jgi:WD40 repeat protein
LAVVCLLALVFAPGVRAEERTSWAHDKGTFEKTADGKWVEKAADGTYEFEEKANSDRYVELYDRTRKITVRLTSTQCLVKVGRAPFKATYKGGWSAPAGTKPEPKETTADPRKPGPKETTPDTRAPAPTAQPEGPFTEVAAIKTENVNLCNFGVAVSPDGKYVALTVGTAFEPDLGIIEVGTRKVVKRWKEPTLVQPLVWSADGSTLAGIMLGEAKPDGRRSQVLVWDTTTWEQRFTFDTPGFPGALGLSADGNVLAVANGSISGPGSLNVWDVTAKKTIFTQELNGSTPLIALAADGKSVAANGFGPQFNQTVVFDLPRGKPRLAVPGVDSFTLSADGKSLVRWGYGANGLQVAVWDLRGTPQPGRVIQGDRWKPDSLALIDRDRHVVLGGGMTQDEVRVYELRTGKLAYTFPTSKKPGRGRRMLIVRPVPDSSLLLTYGSDGVVRLWTTSFGEKAAPDAKGMP